MSRLLFQITGGESILTDFWRVDRSDRLLAGRPYGQITGGQTALFDYWRAGRSIMLLAARPLCLHESLTHQNPRVNNTCKFILQLIMLLNNGCDTAWKSSFRKKLKFYFLFCTFKETGAITLIIDIKGSVREKLKGNGLTSNRIRYRSLLILLLSVEI